MFFGVLLLICGCSMISSLDDVLPDNRDKYKKSQSLPDLEIPPDLTTDVLSDPLAIPDHENADTLSEFQRIKQMRKEGVPARGVATNNVGEDWLTIKKDVVDVWTKLREFWLEKDFVLDIDDLELGVLETEFKDVVVDGSVAYRVRYKLFLEDAPRSGEQLLFLEQESQKNVSTDPEQAEWVLQTDDEGVKKLLTELDVYFHGRSVIAEESEVDLETETSLPDLTTGDSRDESLPRADILNVGEDKEYLAIPSEFSKAWRDVKKIMETTGIYIESESEEEGLYSVLYYPKFDDDKQEQGLLDTLAFWKDSENETGRQLQISLTGVGLVTEVLILDVEGNWLTDEDAVYLLGILKDEYNRSFN